MRKWGSEVGGWMLFIATLPVGIGIAIWAILTGNHRRIDNATRGVGSYHTPKSERRPNHEVREPMSQTDGDVVDRNERARSAE
jgi:hypothetical protein